MASHGGTRGGWRVPQGDVVTCAIRAVERGPHRREGSRSTPGICSAFSEHLLRSMMSTRKGTKCATFFPEMMVPSCFPRKSCSELCPPRVLRPGVWGGRPLSAEVGDRRKRLQVTVTTSLQWLWGSGWVSVFGRTELRAEGSAEASCWGPGPRSSSRPRGAWGRQGGGEAGREPSLPLWCRNGPPQTGWGELVNSRHVLPRALGLDVQGERTAASVSGGLVHRGSLSPCPRAEAGARGRSGAPSQAH